MSTPEVSILLSTLDENELVRTVHEMYRTVSGIDYELVVCTPFPVSGERIIWARDESPRGSTAAFNRAFAVARGEYVSLITDSKRFVPGWLARTLAFLARADDGRAPFAACMKMFNPFVGELVLGTALGQLYPWLWTQRRASFATIGGLLNPELHSFCADLDFGFRMWRAGGKIAAVPDTHYVHLLDVPRLRPDTAGGKLIDFDRFVQDWYPHVGAGYGEILPDGRMGIAPQVVAYDIPESFWPAYMADDAIRIADRSGFPTWGWMLAWAPHHARRLGVPIPADVRAEPARVAGWLQSLGIDLKPLAR